MTEVEGQICANLKEQVAQKEWRIQELVALLMGAVLRIEELERRLSKDGHNSNLPPSRNHGKRKPARQRNKNQKLSGGQLSHPGYIFMQVQTPAIR